MVLGNPKGKKGTIKNCLERKTRVAGQSIWGSSHKGVNAYTEWEKVCFHKGIALLCCMPTTGRTHQIRVHLSEKGYPILGDVQYGYHAFVSVSRVLLHAWKLTFLHPETKKEIALTASVPQSFFENDYVVQLFKKAKWSFEIED